VVKVRHSVTDVSTSTSDKLETAWESRYNANNMMVYEGYWYGADDGAASDNPTGANLFDDDERNQLVKAIYNAKVDGLQQGSWPTSLNRQLSPRP